MSPGDSTIQAEFGIRTIRVAAVMLVPSDYGITKNVFPPILQRNLQARLHSPRFYLT